MRKQDYAKLAELIRTEYIPAREHAANGNEKALAGMRVAEGLARAFASSASVDPVAFLAACGIESAPMARVVDAAGMPLSAPMPRADAIAKARHRHGERIEPT